MLVLSRKMGERIHIGEEIFVEVRRVAGNRVTLAVSAPRSVRILRGELFQTNESGGVLDDDHVISESTIDTVIMRDAQASTMGTLLAEATKEIQAKSSNAVPTSS